MTITTDANAVLSSSLANACSNAQTLANDLTPANIAASATASGKSLATLTAARELFGGTSGLTDHDSDFVRRAELAAQFIVSNS